MTRNCMKCLGEISEVFIRMYGEALLRCLHLAQTDYTVGAEIADQIFSSGTQLVSDIVPSGIEFAEQAKK